MSTSDELPLSDADDLDLLTVDEAAGRLRAEIEQLTGQLSALQQAGAPAAEISAATRRLTALSEALERHERVRS
jgi:hypothetical protein